MLPLPPGLEFLHNSFNPSIDATCTNIGLLGSNVCITYVIFSVLPVEPLKKGLHSRPHGGFPNLGNGAGGAVPSSSPTAVASVHFIFPSCLSFITWGALDLLLDKQHLVPLRLVERGILSSQTISANKSLLTVSELLVYFEKIDIRSHFRFYNLSRLYNVKSRGKYF